MDNMPTLAADSIEYRHLSSKFSKVQITAIIIARRSLKPGKQCDKSLDSIKQSYYDDKYVIHLS